ncbi:uncharacterized protein LOC124418492 [Lucilia cuprina]|uniref:uncharacterized protein LOC124418492 n=1 Tax=Lucilia cuprina TaxID=7375 RepID=UPI001F05D428|nr:uncharacterized protein LOC124418492 [Lucilia cuprina]
MEVKNIQYYLYNDNGVSTAEAVMVEENRLLKQLEEAVSASKDQHSEDEINAAVAMMLMHYQAITEPELTPKNNFITQVPQPKEKQLKASVTITKVNSTQNINLNTIEQQIRQNRKSSYSKSSLLSACRNILKEFLSQNSF